MTDPQVKSCPQTRLVVEQQTRYYPVRGEYAWQVLRGVEQSGLYSAKHRRQASATAQWFVGWKGRMLPPGHVHDGEPLTEWRLSQCDVLVKITLTYPRWTPVPLRSKSRFRRWLRYRLIRRWRKYLAGLRRHEEGHARIAVEAGESMHARLVDLPGAASKQALEASINGLNRQVVKECRKAQARYEERTRFGLLQGASWNAEWYVSDAEARRVT